MKNAEDNKNKIKYKSKKGRYKPMKKQTIMTTTIGTINLAEIELMEDCLDIFIPIVSVSENLRATIEENIQEAKEKRKNSHVRRSFSFL